MGGIHLEILIDILHYWYFIHSAKYNQTMLRVKEETNMIKIKVQSTSDLYVYCSFRVLLQVLSNIYSKPYDIISENQKFSTSKDEIVFLNYCPATQEKLHKTRNPWRFTFSTGPCEVPIYIKVLSYGWIFSSI